MIDGDKALEYLKNKLINLINKGEINASYDQSNNTISFYISDIVATNRPLLSLRLSNHHENFNNRERQRGELPQGDSNISIELYKPSEDKKNRVRKKVTHFYSVEKPQVIPFSVTTIEYIPEKMQEQDVTLIYQSILNWIRSRNKGATYIDPLKGTSRQASMKTHQANIKLKREVTRAEMNFYKRYGMGDSLEPRYNIIKENNQINCNKNMNRNRKNVVRLTESKLRNMIKESVNTCLNEMHLERNYTDKKGNKISGKKALKQQGEDMWGVNNYNLDNNRAIYNQAKHLQVVLKEFTKNLLRNPYNRNKPITPAPNGQEMFQDEIIDLAKRIEIALEGVLKTPHYGDYYNYSDYD